MRLSDVFHGLTPPVTGIDIPLRQPIEWTCPGRVKGCARAGAVVVFHQRPNRFHSSAEFACRAPAGLQQTESFIGKSTHTFQNAVPLRGFHPLETRSPLNTGRIARHEPFHLTPAKQQPAFPFNHNGGAHQTKRLPSAQCSG